VPPAETACAAPTSQSHATVFLTINEGAETGGAFRAKLDTATINAFFQADDAGSAPQDIHIWLSPNHGTIDQAPLIIRRCSISGEAHLSSPSPTLVSITYSVEPRNYAITTPVTLQARFLRPIVGIGIEPKGQQTLSLIDQAPVIAEFFDGDGNSVATDTDRTVKFVSNNSLVGPKEQTITVKSGARSADNVVLPYRTGSAILFVTADGLQAATHELQVVGMIVFMLCVAGGLFGALVSYYTAGGRLPSRLVIGMAAGIVLSWAYVFAILPKVDSIVAHNYISVFVVSLLGGYLGIKAIDLVVKRLGW